MSEELDVLKIICLRLEQAHIPYMLTGSVAGNFYAVPRMTRDIDIVLEIKNVDVERVVNLFNKDFYIEPDSIHEAIEQQSLFNIIHNEYVVKVDFIVRKGSPYREVEFQRRRCIDLNGSSIWIVAPEDLIISKLEWAKDSYSDRQLNDIRNLIRAGNLDREYMQQWIQKLGLGFVYEEVLKENENG